MGCLFLSITRLVKPTGWSVCITCTVHRQVLGEDLVLVSGQQDRMQRGADTWAHPVSYDKLVRSSTGLASTRSWHCAVACGQQVSEAAEE